jgi:glucose-6-phosphate isomerase
VEDNVDPERMAALFDVIDVEQTMFNCVTKSGATSETMSQFLIIYDLLKSKLGRRAKENIIATTDGKKGNLIKIAKEEGFKTFIIPDGVGGRFSELSPVGLLPAAVTGIDIKALLDGAKEMNERCRDAVDMYDDPALFAALMMYVSMQKNKNISVIMPYADSLKLISDWYCQLWGESLGKSVNRNGEEVFVGQTPVKALGVTDQHSQIQLYTEGPFDKVVTFIGVENFRAEVTIPHGFDDIPDISFLGGATLNRLINTELDATEFALTKAGRPNFRIILEKINAHTIGQLLQFFMLQTAYCGELLDFDAYNQPGVEEGKNANYALFGKKGYEQKKKELAQATAKNDKYCM